MTIGDLAYYSASLGLKDVGAGKKALFPALPHDALVDLARMTIATRQNRDDPQDLTVVPRAKWLSTHAESSVHELAYSISLLIPVLHEVSHIEQSYCGRGVATEGKDDIAARLMLTGERDYQVKAQLYELLTCSHLSRTELDADLRSMDMLLRYLEKEAPAAIEKARFNFSKEVDEPTRRDLRGLVRFSREVALMSFIYGAEYDLLIYDNPERGLALVRGEPSPTGSLKPYIDYYLRAGDDSTIRRIRGHLEPAFRTVQLSKALHMERLWQVNQGKSFPATHLRVAPFAIGRFYSMRRVECGAKDNEQSLRNVADYVLEAYVASPGQEPSSGRGDIAEANALLARFLAPGADRVALTKALRPSLADCRAIFAGSFADKAYQYCEAAWRSGEFVISMHPEQTEVLVSAIRSDDLRASGEATHLPRGYAKIANVIRPGITIYVWEYVRPGKMFGMAYDGLYYVNDHWVWIPKPYRIE
jgi:hypothetical protein